MREQTNKSYIMAISEITNEKVNMVIGVLKEIEVDGETMEHILDEVGMSEQMKRQLNSKKYL